jgi:hypothetical protein
MSTYRITCAANRNFAELPARALQRLCEPIPIHQVEFQLLRLEY